MTPLLSILTAAVPSRLDKVQQLAQSIESQCAVAGIRGEVEHLVLLDNKTRSVGLKRQALLDVARGIYITYVDDDDHIAEDYVRMICGAAMRGPDVITFRQRAVINGEEGYIEFSGNAAADEPWEAGKTVSRLPWHVCAWRRELVADCVFPDINDGEDIVWCRQARERVKTCGHIHKVLHTYLFNRETSEATGR